VTSVLWFRRDLRLHDLPALAAAVAAGPVAPLFVLDDRLLNGRWPSPNRAAFLGKCLAELGASLRSRGSRLHIRRGAPEDVVPQFAAEAGATDVFVSRDYSPYARSRDRRVAKALEANGIQFHARRGVLVHEPEEVLSDSGQPYSVYSPFRRRWESLERRMPLAAPDSLESVDGLDAGELPDFGELPPGAPIPGEAAAQERLRAWAAGRIDGYAEGRDSLAAGHTSRLSQDLKWGLLSPLQVVAECAGPGADHTKFVSEVAWREFYYHVLWHNPRVLREPFQRQFAGIAWFNNPAAFEAWKRGKTGYPVVDAAMRELLATGYMHNRARMIVASFLTKDLHIDWRLGESHFMDHLLDGDVANNNGGWQWAASTGTDPQPYFRIFNPLLQSKKFDPDGEYIRRWVPELARVADAHIHASSAMPREAQAAVNCIIGHDYPAPIVDHHEARAISLELYNAARASQSQDT